MGITITNSYFIIIFFTLFSMIANGQEALNKLSVSNSTKSVNRNNQTKIVKPIFKSQPKANLYLKAGYVNWGEDVLLNTADNRSENVNLTYSGFLLGFDLNEASKESGFNLGAGIGIVQINAYSDNTTINYKQVILNNFPAFVDLGYKFVLNEKGSLIFSGGILNRYFKPEPQQSILTQYEFEKVSTLVAVASAELGWSLTSNFRLNQKIIHLFQKNSSVGWNISFSYIL